MSANYFTPLLPGLSLARHWETSVPQMPWGYSPSPQMKITGAPTVNLVHSPFRCTRTKLGETINSERPKWWYFNICK